MLSIKLLPFSRVCKPTTGGVSRAWIFDRDDFNFTQGAANANGAKPPYTVITRRAGADPDNGAVLFPIVFAAKTAQYKYGQSRANISSKYDHSLEFLMPDLDHFITQWNEMVDAASACHGIGLILELASGKFFVLGEKYVNNARITDWQIVQDGSSGDSGKLFEDLNGQTTILKGDYKRSAYEFTGGAEALEAFEDEGS